MNERDCSSDEVVGGDGVPVGAVARVDVEGPAVTGGRAHRGRGEGGTVPGEGGILVCSLRRGFQYRSLYINTYRYWEAYVKGLSPALALAGFDPLPAGGDVVPVRHGLGHHVGPAQI